MIVAIYPFTMFPPSNGRREAVGNSSFLTVVSAPRFSVWAANGDTRRRAPLRLHGHKWEKQGQEGYGSGLTGWSRLVWPRNFKSDKFTTF